MKTTIISSFIIGVSSLSFANATSSTLLPYIQINIGDPTYVAQSAGSSATNSISTLASANLDTSKIDPSSMVINFPGGAKPNLQINPPSGQVFLLSVVPALPKATGNCQILNGDPNKVSCSDGITFNASGVSYSVPIIYYNGLYPKSVYQLTMQRSRDLTNNPNNMESKMTPNYLEISAVPTDSGTIVPLNQYFANTNAKTTYKFDSCNVNQLAGASGFKCNIPLLTTPNVVANGSHLPKCANGVFGITNGSLVTKKALSSGVYQINVKATGQYGEVAYQTFYINVNANNPNLASWRNGAAATTNVLGSFPTIYAYASTDPGSTSHGDWWPSYASYALDLKQANQLLTKQGATGIKSIFLEIITATYPVGNNGKGQTYWNVNSAGYPQNPDPSATISNTWLSTNRDTCWLNGSGTCVNNLDTPAPNGLAPLPYLLSLYAGNNLGVLLNFDFDNTVRAQFSSYNPTEEAYFVQTVVNPVALSYATVNGKKLSVDGLSMDLEGGYNAQGAIQAYKDISDRLAYAGKAFSFFGFPDTFTPEFFAAMGPLGTANFSSYDIGQYRAPADTNSAYIQNMIPYSTFWSATDANDFIAQTFALSQQCSTASAGLYRPGSYCSLSSVDSYSENYRRFSIPTTSTDPKIQISPANSILAYNGKFTVVLPLAATATEWVNMEVWFPDFTAGNTPPMLLNKTACAGINNAYIKQHAADINNPNSALAQCVMNLPMTNHPEIHYQNVKACKGYSLDQCMLVSSLPGGSVQAAGVLPQNDVATLAANNLDAYLLTNPNAPATSTINQAMLAHMSGYSLFALQNNMTANSLQAGIIGTKNPSLITLNAVVSEPLYAGWNGLSDPNYPIDPQYNAASVTQIWNALGVVLKNK